MYKRILSISLSLAMVLSSFAPSAYALTAEISGNGSNSDSEVEVESEQNTTVVQNNSAHIVNNVSTDLDTGNNDVNDNTGGDITLITGNASATVDLRTAVNLNEANVQTTSLGDLDLLISGNGSFSDNEIEIEPESNTNIFQDNFAAIHNYVDADLDTGHNDVNRNTDGDIAVITGHATADIGILNLANANFAYVGNGGNGSPSLDAQIVGNGSYSDNEIEVEDEQNTLIVQNNSAHIRNRVRADLDTGHNDVNDNTGGDILLDTGNATLWVDIGNWANLNVANVDGEWTWDDSFLKISGNGSFSDNEIEIEPESNTEVFQGCETLQSTFGLLLVNEVPNHLFDPCFDVENRVWSDLDTGKNDLERNTGDPDGDPVVITGHASSDIDIHNKANANLFNSFGGGIDLPDFDFDFDLGGLFGGSLWWWS